MQHIKEHYIDLVFMDINLKDSCKDGIETTKDIKELQNIHIIYITAYNDIHTIQRVIQTNPVGYLIEKR